MCAVDDNAFVNLRYDNSLRGSIWASQVAIGSKNDLSLKLVGDRAAIDWEQENPNELRFSKIDEPSQINCTVPSIADGLQACPSFRPANQL